jgi:hypothetical protein
MNREDNQVARLGDSFLDKFTKQGFIEYRGELPITINNSLLSVVLHD